MKSITELTPGNNRTTREFLKKFTKAAESKPPLDDVNVSRLFASMTAKYDQRWTSRFPKTEALKLAKHEWAKSLSGVSVPMLTYGLEQCLTQYPSWPPTIGEFKALCVINPKDLNMPSVDDAWSQLCIQNKPFTHGVVLAASRDEACDVYTWRLLPMTKGVKLFEPIYQKYLSLALDGEEYELPTMLEDKQGKPTTWAERKEHANNHMAAMRKALKSPAPCKI